MIPKEAFQKACADQGIQISEDNLACLDRYAQFLLAYNEKVNLTAIVEPWQVALKHFLDSLLLLKACEVPKGAALVDVGSGAGFPGVPVKILRPDIKVTLLDSQKKRVTFLEELRESLGLRYQATQLRAEEAGQNPQYRESFDIATARAVAALPVLCEYCLPLVRVGGYFLAMKARGVEAELEGAANALRLLGGELVRVAPFVLPDGSGRAIVVIKKISHTLAKYPRCAAKMAKKPL